MAHPKELSPARILGEDAGVADHNEQRLFSVEGLGFGVWGLGLRV